MEKSVYAELLDKYFPKFKPITERINENAKRPPLLFETMLRKELSVDLKWESNAINSNLVAADVVAMDSDIPLKSRPTIEHAHGDIPKIAMKFKMSEKATSDIDVLRARGVDETTVVSKLLKDAINCTEGIKERIEYMFLKGLSDGVTVVPNADNVGVGVRLDFLYKDENKFGAEVRWGNTGYTPLSDIQRVISEAARREDYVTKVVMSRETYNLLRKSDEGKQLVATLNGAVVATQNLLTPSPSRFNEAFKDETGAEIIVVDRSVKIEKNGQFKSTTPFNGNKVVFITSDVVGTLFYGTLAEDNHRVEGVNYTKPNDYTLISVYHETSPFAEFTAGQALVVPVIENAQSIYVLDITDAQAKAAGETEGDTTITIWNTELTKATVISALATLGVTVDAGISDADLINVINKLSTAKEKALKTALNVA